MPNELNEKQLITARAESHLYMANISAKANLKLTTPLAFFEKNFNISYEELGCVGYNPDSSELTATIKIKRSSGYGGNLCTDGSYEFVRFYVDFGGGYKDQGYVGVNVHDILDSYDCDKKIEKPIEFAVRMKLNVKRQICSKPFLPKVKAVLLWNTIPPANDPNLVQPGYVWGNVKEARIQIKPFKLIIPITEIGGLLEKSILNPHISLKNIVANDPIAHQQLSDAKNVLTANKTSFSQLVADYKKEKTEVESHRMGFKFLAEALMSHNIEAAKNASQVFAENKLDYSKSLSALIASKGNVNYEEINCVALDYHKEALVATFTAKKNYGYGGNLCSAGSKEYVTFWIKDESTNCEWKKVGTTVVNLHDIPGHTGLNYSAILPYDFTKFKTSCDKPRVLKVRAVLSWNVEPTGLDTPYWGNFKESYVQLAPKTWTGTQPKMLIVGGIPVAKIDDVSGLTLPGAKFEDNQNDVITGSRFMGKISIYGVSVPYAGMKYRIKVINLDSGGSYYVNEPFAVSDIFGTDPQPVVYPDVDNYYTYQPFSQNFNGKLALFSPGTNSRLKIIIEHQDGSSDSQVIQMDNILPDVSLMINDEGECVHYPKGGTILGKFKAVDNFIYKFSLGVSGGKFTELKFSGVPQVIGAGEANNIVRTVNVVDGEFKILTATDKNCGMISLEMEHKTVVDSGYMANPVYAYRQFCLKD